MSILVRTITEAVCRIGKQPYDERDGRHERDQTITEQALAQKEWNHSLKESQA